MAKLSKSNKNLDYYEIAETFDFREKSLRLFFSTKNPDYGITFAGFSNSEVLNKLSFELSEIEKDACLNILASIEARFRLDYAIRCEKKDKSDISRKFRQLYFEQQYKIPFEDGILEIWKNEPTIRKSIISNLKGAFKYRHWLAHGRYWILKAGRPEYDFYSLYLLAIEVDTLPLKN